MNSVQKRRGRRAPLVVLVAAVSAFALGCGSSDDNDKHGSSTHDGYCTEYCEKASQAQCLNGQTEAQCLSSCAAPALVPDACQELAFVGAKCSLDHGEYSCVNNLFTVSGVGSACDDEAKALGACVNMK